MNPIDLTQQSQYPNSPGHSDHDSDVEEIPQPVKKAKLGRPKVAFSQKERMKFPPTSPFDPKDLNVKIPDLCCDEEIVYSCPYCEDVNWDKAMIVDQCNVCRNLKVLIQDLCTCDERWAEAGDSGAWRCDGCGDEEECTCVES